MQCPKSEVSQFAWAQVDREQARKQAAAAAVEEVEEVEEAPTPGPQQPTSTHAAAAAVAAPASSSQPDTTHSAAAMPPAAAQHNPPPTQHQQQAVAPAELPEAGGPQIRQRTAEAEVQEVGGLQIRQRPAAAEASGLLTGNTSGMAMDEQSGGGASYAPSQSGLLTRGEVKAGRGPKEKHPSQTEGMSTTDDQASCSAYLLPSDALGISTNVFFALQFAAPHDEIWKYHQSTSSVQAKVLENPRVPLSPVRQMPSQSPSPPSSPIPSLHHSLISSGDMPQQRIMDANFHGSSLAARVLRNPSMLPSHHLFLA